MLLNKWFATALSCAAFSLTACGGQNNTASTPAAPSTPATPASVVASAPATTGKVYRVAMNAEFAPFESRNEKQEVEGFDVDLMREMAQAGGFQVEFLHKPWESLFPELNAGDVDIVMSGVTITDERKQSMDFTDSYYQIKQIVLVPSGKDIKNVEDLKKMNKVGVVTGYTGDLAAQKIFGTTSQAIARFETVPLMLKEVENGGLDAAISDSAVIANYVKNNNDKGFTMVEVPDFEIENYGIAVKKGNTELLNTLNAALKTVRENGKYNEVESKYFAK
ncbi:MAG: basic amino acid ABC transporter substrate-binding protein [Alysiella sp.]|uniref:basic amino acid ABC transporter substrate-binding protein n=1 Tax=Alysiella sp. TaxID=1872483 RepID=UPI0026DB05A4|nr:basic amino acid ABC transporter substrate-binding protein [Alysiella sp.]MDO4433818.1 basic amino acid ABC transporter substrate-binding protein [Alysiella sp.]